MKWDRQSRDGRITGAAKVDRDRPCKRTSRLESPAASDEIVKSLPHKHVWSHYVMRLHACQRLFSQIGIPIQLPQAIAVQHFKSHVTAPCRSESASFHIWAADFSTADGSRQGTEPRLSGQPRRQRQRQGELRAMPRLTLQRDAAPVGLDDLLRCWQPQARAARLG